MASDTNQPGRTPRIHVGVGGRFHADYMSESLLEAGYDVTLVTSYPASRFPRLPRSRIRSVLWPELAFRLGARLGLGYRAEAYKMQAFGRGLARCLAREGKADVFLCWSSFALESLRRGVAATQIVVRDSAHILYQTRVLSEAYAEQGLRFADRQPTEEREMEEYERADYILVPSQFAKRTFLEQGVAESKLKVLCLGINTSRFFAPPSLETRLPLRVIYFGTLSVQKGVHHLLEATRDLAPDLVELTCLGPVDPEFRPLLARFRHARFLPPMPHPRLAPLLREYQVMAFPSLHDGFGMVVPQAMASGLVPVVSDRCGAQELIRPGENGLVVPAANPAALGEALRGLAADPARVSRLRAEAARIGEVWNWADYGRDLSQWVGHLLGSVPTPSLAASSLRPV